MMDPIEIFGYVYREWRPPERPMPKASLFLWPALAGALTFGLLLLSQQGPTRITREPSAILVDQMSQVENQGLPGDRG